MRNIKWLRYGLATAGLACGGFGAVLAACGDDDSGVTAADAGKASLRVYDSMGRVVRTLGTTFAAGRNEVTWDLRGSRGERVSPGVYFARLAIGKREWSQRVVVIP